MLAFLEFKNVAGGFDSHSQNLTMKSDPERIVPSTASVTEQGKKGNKAWLFTWQADCVGLWGGVSNYCSASTPENQLALDLTVDFCLWPGYLTESEMETHPGLAFLGRELS